MGWWGETDEKLCGDEGRRKMEVQREKVTVDEECVKGNERL